MTILKIQILLLLIVCPGFKFDGTKSLVGMWQSLNDANSVLEITTERKIILYKGGKSFWIQTTKNGELNFKSLSQQNNWIEFQANDGDEFFFNGKVEIVDKDRIRVYIFKHHNILDVADEYYRTKDFNSFDEIMRKIMEDKLSNACAQQRI